MKQRWFVFVIAACVMSALVLFCGFIAFAIGIVSFPSTDTLARRYLDAVIKEDMKSAVDLADSEEGCRIILVKDVEKDIARFGATEIQNVVIKVNNGTGSDDGIQIAVITFEYRESTQSMWQHGGMRLLTDYSAPGFRFLCENLEYHGP